MPRAKRGFKARRRRNRVLKWAKGFRGKRKNCHAIANESVQHAWMHMYRSRKVRKRDFRSLWIQRINAAARALGISYSKLMGKLPGNERPLVGAAANKVKEQIEQITDASLQRLVNAKKQADLARRVDVTLP